MPTRSKPPLAPPRNTPRQFYLNCQHYSYRDRQLIKCNAPTKNGKPTCEACAKIEARGAGWQIRNPKWLYG